MYQKQYFVPKTSGTYAETLEAYGLAIILDEIFRANDIQKPKVKIQDTDGFYVISARTEVTEEMVRNTPYFNAFPYIKTEKDKNTNLPSGFIDYVKEKEIHDNFRDFKKSISNLDRNGYKKAIENYENKPHFDYDIFSKIQVNSLGGYLKAFNNVFTNKDYYSEFLKQILLLYSSLQDDAKSVDDNFRKLKKENKFNKIEKIKSLQFFNPHQGKGVNSEKSNSISLKQLPLFWFKEYLKMAGCYKSMLVEDVKVSDQKWDSKFYVVEPRSLELNLLNTIYRSFKPSITGISSVKLDISSILRYTKIFIEKSEEYQQKKPSFSKRFNPQEFVSGFHTAYQKNLGQNPAVSNIGYLRLPDFIEISSYEEGNKWIHILDEHVRVISKINEDIGSTTSMLHHYRQFLSSGVLDEFFEFNFEYAALLMHDIALPNRHAGKRWLEPFALNLLEEFLMSAEKEFKPILEVEGFRNVAKAIRKSTISEQYRKAKGKQQFDICYGMAQDLKRKSPYKEDLVTYLSEFIANYNAETARFVERHPELAKAGKVRATVKMQDIDELVGLIDEYGSDVIGKLLSAYGYALDRKEKFGEPAEDSKN